MESEIKGKFIDNMAWDVIRYEEGMDVVKSRWVLKFTNNDDGSIRSVKCKLVACGYSQRAGIDYFEVYAKTPAGPNIRLFSAVVADGDLETYQIDAVKAFTQADVEISSSRCPRASGSQGAYSS
eukprot:597072-Prymnesium_polylepis.1